MAFRTLKDINVSHKKVLVRVDFNVPLNSKGVEDNTRIRAALPTIRYLRRNKAIVILMTHLGRPKGVDDRLRLDSVAKELSRLLKVKIHKVDDVIGEEAEQEISELRPGEVCLLENLRFHIEEEKDDKDFARSLADFADIYVNDAFAVSHRAHASVHAITKYLPSVAGFQLQKEIEMMDKILHDPKRPYVAVMGGAKVSDKIEVIEKLLKKVDALLIGGAMMFTFLKATGLSVGKSRFEKDKVSIAKKLMKKTKGKIMLPTDCLVSTSPDGKPQLSDVRRIPSMMMGLDIGRETVTIYSEILREAKTIVWNGPLGMFEVKKFANGTNEIARIIAKNRGKSVIGGGDTIDAINKLKLGKRFTHVSTGGGASLDFIAGKVLPGIKALEENFKR